MHTVTEQVARVELRAAITRCLADAPTAPADFALDLALVLLKASLDYLDGVEGEQAPAPAPVVLRLIRGGRQ